MDFTADESSGKAAIASFPPLTEEENWKMDFTAYERGGKAATASLPPLKAEESWKSQLIPPMRAAVRRQLPVFLLSERWKTGKRSYTGDESGGKAA